MFSLPGGFCEGKRIFEYKTTGAVNEFYKLIGLSAHAERKMDIRPKFQNKANFYILPF
jgi:hypothetical protein